MNKRLLKRILPHGSELLRRLALAEVLGPPPSGSARHEQMKGGPRAPGAPRVQTSLPTPPPLPDVEE